jgi:hypothetical protein
MKGPKLPLSVFMAKAPGYSCQHQTSIKIENEEIISLLLTETLYNSLHSCYLHLRRYSLMLLVTTFITKRNDNRWCFGYWRRHHNGFQMFAISSTYRLSKLSSIHSQYIIPNLSILLLGREKGTATKFRRRLQLFIASHRWNGERQGLNVLGIVVAKPFQGRSHLKATFLNVNYSPDIFYFIKSIYSVGEFVIVRLLQLEITSEHTFTSSAPHITHSRV